MAGYWVVKTGPIRDVEAQRAYMDIFSGIARRYKAEVIAGTGRVETVEGPEFPRQFIVRFGSFETAQAAYRDPEYQASLALVERAFDREMAILEGPDRG